MSPMTMGTNKTAPRQFGQYEFLPIAWNCSQAEYIRIMSIDSIVENIRAKGTSTRQIIAVAGPPAAGKSTVSEALCEEFGDHLVVLPMDGFHLDNAILDAKDMRARKGSPPSFDALGFMDCVKRVKAGELVYAPEFDRSLDLARSCAIEISDQPIVLVEGNYLLLEIEPWLQLRPLWDLTIWLDISLETVEARSIQRWLDHGYDIDYAKRHALGNDVPNAAFTIENSAKADIVVKNDHPPG